ncbi:MAG: hypothetical protein IPP34_17495 [Bacteroidetes bacterium]|nr:hypothetical protein [Bacteroidota bacterium]
MADGNESQYAKVDWICVRKHRFSASLFNVKAGFWCLKCKKEEEREEVTAYAKEIIDLNGGKCLTTKKFGFKDIISVQCGFGHKWAIQAERVFYGSWCKVCDKERKVSEFLDRLHASGWKIIGGKMLIWTLSLSSRVIKDIFFPKRYILLICTTIASNVLQLK